MKASCLRLLSCLSVLALAGQTHAAPVPRAIDPAHFDTTCAPCRDFYQYANGGWLDHTELPPAYPRYGSAGEQTDRNQEVVRDLLEAAVRDLREKPGSSSARIGLFYGTCMDSERAEADGAKPIADELARITAISKPAELTAAVAHLHAGGIPALFQFGSTQDPTRSTEMIAFVAQGGLGLPDRDFYTRTDSTSVAIRERYVTHIARTLELLGDPAAAAAGEAHRVMAIEGALANSSMTNVQRRDPNALVHKMSVAELATLAPAIDWPGYLKLMGVPPVATINVTQPDFFRSLNELLGREVPLDAWKAYLRWSVANAASPLLSRAFVNENFEFRRALSGERSLQPRWKRCLQLTDQSLGEALGEEYVHRTFSPEARAQVVEMVDNVKAVLRERIAGLEWMSDSTRARALAKLDALHAKVGYPDHWRDYSTLKLERGAFYANWARARTFETRRQLARIGRPLDRSEWNMTPPTVNAYYSPRLNEIVIPAGILQPPVFDPHADAAVNYGGIGCTIGHEITHGFDDQGRQFDPDGNLRDWWTADDATRFRDRANKVADQFGGYIAVDDVHLNGRLTLGENLADLGGIAISYAALERSLRGKPRPLIDGWTPEQRFFLSRAQVRREKMRPEIARTMAATDPHSPGRWRINGPYSNLPEFAQAFGCHEGDAMVRPDSLRARIW
jgi:putative endopeptidase